MAIDDAHRRNLDRGHYSNDPKSLIILHGRSSAILIEAIYIKEIAIEISPQLLLSVSEASKYDSRYAYFLHVVMQACPRR